MVLFFFRKILVSPSFLWHVVTISIYMHPKTSPGCTENASVLAKETKYLQFCGSYFHYESHHGPCGLDNKKADQPFEKESATRRKKTTVTALTINL